MTAGKSFAELTELSVQSHRVLAETVGEITGERDWVQLTSKPELNSSGVPIVQGRDGRKFTFSGGVVDKFNQSGEHIPVDIEHEAQQGISKVVVGWITQMAFRNDHEIWGFVEWNEEGRKILSEKSFRSISPAFRSTPESIEKFVAKEQDFLEIDVFESVAVTNFPNLKVRSLNSKRDSMNREKILQVLQLHSQATEDEVLERVSNLVSQTKDIEKLVPRTDYDTVVMQLNSLKKEIGDLHRAQHSQKVRDVISNALSSGKISPASVDYHKECCATEEGLRRFENFISVAPDVISNKSQFEGKEEPKTLLTEEQKNICSMFNITQEKFLEQQKRLEEEGKLNYATLS